MGSTREKSSKASSQGIAEGVAATGLRVNLIGILSRTYGAEIAMKELDALLAYRDHFVALDLAGDEANYPRAAFCPPFCQGPRCRLADHHSRR